MESNQTGCVISNKYCSAGHLPPFPLRRDGNATCLNGDTGVALALMECRPFQSGQSALVPGGVQASYTSGVLGAFSPAGATFGEGGMVRVLAETTAAGLVRHVPELTRGIVAAKDRFAAQAAGS